MSNKVVLATKKRYNPFVIFSNLTSQSDATDFTNIDFVIADENSMTLMVPKSSCAEGHNLSLYIFGSDKQPKKIFKNKKMPNDKSTMNCIAINGKISSAEKMDEETIEIIVTLSDNFIDEWEKLLKSFNNRQDNFSNLMKKYRE